MNGIAMQKLDFFIGKGQFGGGFWFFLVVGVNFFVEIVELYCWLITFGNVGGLLFMKVECGGWGYGVLSFVLSIFGCWDQDVFEFIVEHEFVEFVEGDEDEQTGEGGAFSCLFSESEAEQLFLSEEARIADDFSVNGEISGERVAKGEWGDGGLWSLDFGVVVDHFRFELDLSFYNQEQMFGLVSDIVDDFSFAKKLCFEVGSVEFIDVVEMGEEWELFDCYLFLFCGHEAVSFDGLQLKLRVIDA